MNSSIDAKDYMVWFDLVYFLNGISSPYGLFKAENIP